MPSPTTGHRVAVLGTGSMGTAIAKALIEAGHHVTVWNRSRERLEGLAGCRVAQTAGDACLDADVAFTCFSNFAATHDVLEQQDVVDALRGKVLVAMSTATPDQVHDLQRFAEASGIDYLDAKIAVTPAQIGAPTAVIFFAGPQAIFSRIEPVLKALAGRATLMGERIDGAVQGDFAFLSVYFAGTIGILHGAAFSRSSGLDIDQFFSLIPCFLDEINARSQSFRKMILAGDYSDVQSALKTDLAGARLLADATVHAGMQRLFPDALIDLMQDAVAQGHGDLDSAAMVEAFGKKSRTAAWRSAV
ncbi:NAD(P)-binding domain-containing protein [Mesorhizobium sp. ES1-1]|nr:NAD(P)-binding domain-containing protein [Mesorhizobium sp. ES1-1]